MADQSTPKARSTGAGGGSEGGRRRLERSTSLPRSHWREVTHPVPPREFVVVRLVVECKVLKAPWVLLIRETDTEPPRSAGDRNRQGRDTTGTGRPVPRSA